MITLQTNKQTMPVSYSCGELIMIVIGFILTVVLLLSNRDVDEAGMDSYDRKWSIAKEGYTRGALGTIYKDGEYDVWANMFDHNPYHVY